VDQFARSVSSQGIATATGTFGAHMVVRLANDGPVTIWIDSADLTRD
ncbi:MAG TPA: D-aminoacyl-tRNA deacylase, partial [Thermomicrobiales bacterium]|nr:D-aminoacyl-tRNA deacylase [Thermomicrobiales bacterium]